MLVGRYWEGRDDLAETPDQFGLVRVAQHTELRYPLLPVHPYANRHDCGGPPVSLESASHKWSQALHIQLRPGSIFVVAERALPTAFRTCPDQSPVSELANESVRVHRAKRSGATEDRLKLSLHVRDELFNRGSRVEVWQAKAPSSILAELNHEPPSVPLV
jgi:hypothetical protein